MIPPSPNTLCLKTMCAMTTWFCDAYASWQQGGVENANGRLRAGCRVRSTLTKCPTKKSRTLSLPPISRRENASVSRRHSRRSSKSLGKTSKFSFHKPVAPRSRIHAPPISRRENASVSRRHSRRSSKSLAKTSKYSFHKPVAPRSRIHECHVGRGLGGGLFYGTGYYGGGGLGLVLVIVLILVLLGKL